MKEWCKTLAENLWLKPDEVGEEESVFIRKALRLRKGQSVLDAPCGAGRITIHLAHAGCKVTGIDLRKAFTDRAKARFIKEKQKGTFLPCDLRKMDLKDEFNGIYNWMGSFGYFSETENTEVLKNYVRALKPGGRLLIDQPNRQWLFRNFIAHRQDGDLTVRNKWIPENQRIETDWIVKRKNGKEHNRSSMRLYTLTQMKKLFEKAGLTFESAYGSTSGEPYSRSSIRLIMVGRKCKGSNV